MEIASMCVSLFNTRWAKTLTPDQLNNHALVTKLSECRTSGTRRPSILQRPHPWRSLFSPALFCLVWLKLLLHSRIWTSVRWTSHNKTSHNKSFWGRSDCCWVIVLTPAWAYRLGAVIDKTRRSAISKTSGVDGVRLIASAPTHPRQKSGLDWLHLLSVTSGSISHQHDLRNICSQW